LIPLKAGRNIWGYCDLNDIFLISLLMNSEKDYCKLRPETATRSDILYLFGQGNLIFVREKWENFEKWCLLQSWIW